MRPPHEEDYPAPFFIKNTPRSADMMSFTHPESTSTRDRVPSPGVRLFRTQGEP